MKKFVLHLLQRSKELGPMGMLRRGQKRLIEEGTLSLESIWWGWMSRRKMSDVSLLARTNGPWQTLDDLLRHLANRPAASFLLPHDSPQETAQLLKHYFPQYLADVLASADAASGNKISLLGQDFHYSKDIDWQRDPVTGWQWPVLYRGRMSSYIGSERPVDLILFWELNRHQHFISLGIAYWLTGDQHYVQAFIDQIQSWIKTNPVRHGLNWYYPLEVSIRLMAWTTAFQFFRNSPEFQKKAGADFLKSLWQQTDFLRKHLQPVRAKDDAPNNHLMAELTGLIVVGTAFPEFKNASEWRETGMRLLIEQADAQTYTDGVNKEQATGYHRFIAELLLIVTARSYQGGLRRESNLEKNLEHMLNYILFSLTPEGTSPMWGDSDFGRALGLGQKKNFWDFRPLLSAGAVLFDRPDWKFGAGRFDEEAFWLLGADGLRCWQQIDLHVPEKTSHAFPKGGQYIIRDSWSTDTDVAFFRSGSFGLGGEDHCAHAHSDLLSFVLWIKGQLVLVDSGTFTYHGPLRNYFRRTPAHNTVMVDGCDQAIPKPNFNWQQVSDARCLDWSVTHVTGAFNFSDVEFIRTLHHPQPGEWELDDKLCGNDEHKVEWFFNFAPGLEVHLHEKSRTVTILKEDRPFLTLRIPVNDIHIQLTDGWYSHQYGNKQPIKRLHAEWHGNLKESETIFHWSFELIDTEHILQRGEHVAAV